MRQPLNNPSSNTSSNPNYFPLPGRFLRYPVKKDLWEEKNMAAFFQYRPELVQPLAILVGALIVAALIDLLAFGFLIRLAGRGEDSWIGAVIKAFHRPILMVLVTLVLILVLPSLGIPEPASVFLRHLLRVIVIISVTWLLIRGVLTAERFILERYPIDTKDNLQARRIHTQIQILRKVVIVVLCVLTFSLALMTFEAVRQVGTALLASAGIAGILIGFAAQKSIAALIAGLQMALTQPIRVDDVVIVEQEWGRIEEITLTYVVIRIWDQRRLVVPMTYFLEKPFQNWTRTSAEIMGTVFIYADYSLPVDGVREELERFVKESSLWDGKVCVLQVTQATERTMELRALVSAEDAGIAWDLRCLVREHLIGFIRSRYPQSLPKLQVSLERASGSLERQPG